MILDATLLMLMPPNLKTQELKPKHQSCTKLLHNYPSEMICFWNTMSLHFLEIDPKTQRQKNTEVLAASD